MLRAPRFFLERWIQKGVFHQLLLMAALIAFVALIGGLVAWIATPAFASAPEAVWWAFLRLTDPGYLGDDEGVVLRIVSTIVTVLGYVIFMGSLIAIMTQGLSRTMRKLESGLTPIAMKGHVVILGWTNRTPEIVLRLLSARGRLQRFLERRDVARLRIVILSEEVGAERRLELRAYLGRHWDESRIFLRSGSSLQPDHLERLDIARASAVLVPGADFELGGSESTDARVVKTLMTVDRMLAARGVESRPHLVVEIFDPLKVSLARCAAVSRVEVISSDQAISRLISQSIRHRGLGEVLLEILSHGQGNSLYLRSFPELAGSPPHALHDRFRRAVVLGFVRENGMQREVDLDPHTSATLQRDDLVLLLAERFEDCVPEDSPHASAAPAPGPEQPGHEHKERQRVLVLGWSHKVGALATELDESCTSRFELTVLSRVPIEERTQWLQRVSCSEERLEILHVQGDYALESDLRAQDPAGFDTVVFLASDFAGSSEEADARTILGYVLLRSLLEGSADPPELIVELLDPDNAHLFDRRDHVCLVTPRVLSHLLAHVVLRPELSSVFDELFSSRGAELDLWSAADLGLTDTSHSFPEIQRRALARGVIALGFVTASGGIELNPGCEKSWRLAGNDRLVVLVQQG